MIMKKALRDCMVEGQMIRDVIELINKQTETIMVMKDIQVSNDETTKSIIKELNEHTDLLKHLRDRSDQMLSVIVKHGLFDN